MRTCVDIRGFRQTTYFSHTIHILFFQVKMVNWLNLRSFGSDLVVWLGPYPWLLLTRKRSMAVRRRRGSQVWTPHRNNVASTLSTNRRPRMRNLLHIAKNTKANLLLGGVTSTLFSPIFLTKDTPSVYWLAWIFFRIIELNHSSHSCCTMHSVLTLSQD